MVTLCGKVQCRDGDARCAAQRLSGDFESTANTAAAGRGSLSACPKKRASNTLLSEAREIQRKTRSTFTYSWFPFSSRQNILFSIWGVDPPAACKLQIWVAS